MFGVPFAALVGCLAASGLFTALVAVVVAEYLNQREDHL